MTKKQDINELTRVFQDLLASHTNSITSGMQENLRIWTDFLGHKSSLTTFSITILDLHASRYIYHRPMHNRHLHLPSLSTSIDDNLLMPDRLVHPEARTFKKETEILCYECLMQLPVERQKDFYAAYSCRLLEKDGNYGVYVFYLHMLACDGQGKPWLIKIETDRVRGFSLPLFRYIQSSPQGYAEGHPYSQKILNPGLTSLELKVLECKMRSYKQKEIACLLNMSLNTAKNHYSAIITKMGTSCIEGACLLARITGLFGGLSAKDD